MCWRQLTTRPFGRRAGVNRCKVQYGRGRASANKEGGHAAILANSGVKTAFAENSLTNLARLIRANYSLIYLPAAKINTFDTIESTPTPDIKENIRHNISAQYDFGKYNNPYGLMLSISTEISETQQQTPSDL